MGTMVCHLGIGKWEIAQEILTLTKDVIINIENEKSGPMISTMLLRFPHIGQAIFKVLFGNTGSTDLLTSGFTHEFDKFSITIFIATLWVLWIHEFLSNKWIHDFQRVPAGTLWKLWIQSTNKLALKWIHDFQRVPAGTLWKVWIHNSNLLYLADI